MKDSAKAIGLMLQSMRRPSENAPAGDDEHCAREKVKEQAEEAPSAKSYSASAAGRRPILKEEDLPRVANPRVERALFAARRVVSAVIEQYGAPREIRIEMARDMKASKKHRGEITKAQNENRKRNAEADDELRKLAAQGDVGVPIKERIGQGKNISRSVREKYKMWHYEQNRRCAYCGKCISCGELFQGGAEIEHIFPQASFSQNYGNTVVACVRCNREKGKRTPWQAFDGTDKWPGIEKRAALEKPEMPLPYAKRKRILSKKEDFLSDEDFVERALKDTQHIIAVVAGYLRGAGIKVQPGRGQATATLRNMWNLNKILPRHPDDKEIARDESGFVKYDDNQAKASKNRRDHRHHAVDAFVVAMTDHKTLMNLIRANQRGQDARLSNSEREKAAKEAERDKLLDKVRTPEGWRGGRIAAAVKEKILRKIVAHQKMPRIRGALHKDSFYGLRFYDAGVVSVKTSADAGKLLSPEDVREAKDGDYVADAAVWKILQDWLQQNNNKKTPPPPELHNVRIKRACYVVRKPVAEAVVAACKPRKPGQMGKSYWIADQSMHDILQKWLNGKTFAKSDDKELKAALESDPPRMPSRTGRGNPIRAVQMATSKGANSVRRLHKFHWVEKQNNSHAEVFRRRKKDGSYERKARIVSAIDAAERRSQKQPVINMRPDDSWGEGWEWVFSLSENDIVRFDPDKRDDVRGHAENFGSSVYRVQKMSQGKSGCSFVFRHCSVSVVGDKHGELTVGAAGLDCVKVKTGVLGGGAPADDQADS